MQKPAPCVRLEGDEGQPPNCRRLRRMAQAASDPAMVANAVICLMRQANYLLDRQIAGLERQFIHEGGYSERPATAPIKERQNQN